MYLNKFEAVLTMAMNSESVSLRAEVVLQPHVSDALSSSGNQRLNRTTY